MTDWVTYIREPRQAMRPECFFINRRCALLSALLLLRIPFPPHFLESCLGPGFTDIIPTQEELSQYSATVLQPGDRAIFTALSFRYNGTFVSLTIPSQVRGSEYSLVDDSLTLYLRLSISYSMYIYLLLCIYASYILCSCLICYLIREYRSNANDACR